MIEVTIEIQDRITGDVKVVKRGAAVSPVNLDFLVQSAARDAKRAAGFPGDHWPYPELKRG